MTPEQKAKIIDLFDAGESMASIARQTGLKAHNMPRVLKKLGIVRDANVRERRVIAGGTARACMCCRRGFESWGKGNRLCASCKDADHVGTVESYQVRGGVSYG